MEHKTGRENTSKCTRRKRVRSSEVAQPFRETAISYFYFGVHNVNTDIYHIHFFSAYGYYCVFFVAWGVVRREAGGFWFVCWKLLVLSARITGAGHGGSRQIKRKIANSLSQCSLVFIP